MDPDTFSLVDAIDDYKSEVQESLNIIPRTIKAYIETLTGYEEVRVKWKQTIEETNELSAQISKLEKEMQKQAKQMQDMQFGMTQVRKLLDAERKKRKLAEVDRDFFEAQATQLSDILKDNINKLSRETKEQLNIMKKNRPSTDLVEDRLDAITEFETTGSVISDLSYTRDEDDFDISSSETPGQKRQRDGNRARSKGRKKRRSSSAMRFNELSTKNDKVIATTTVTVDGSNVHATAIIEAKSDSKENALQPSAPPIESEDDVQMMTPVSEARNPLSSNLLNTRTHNFQQKAMLRSESCNVCLKRIKFSTMSVKCRDCKTVCHFICKEKAPLPCVPVGNTPGKSTGFISDYTPVIPPMVPAIVVHCIKEVEARGLSEVGIYRISGSEKEVRALKDKFLRGRGVPNLSQVMDIHVICSCLKDFLRSLSDPLITRARWNEFARAVEIRDESEKRQQLYGIVGNLPQPNRDTLAFLVLHLQRVAEVPDCKMPLKNLANVFGPTIIGYSCNEPENMYGETQIGNKIMEHLLSLPSDYWGLFIKKPDFRKVPSGFLSTPNRTRIIKKIKYFETP